MKNDVELLEMKKLNKVKFLVIINYKLLFF